MSRLKCTDPTREVVHSCETVLNQTNPIVQELFPPCSVKFQLASDTKLFEYLLSVVLHYEVEMHACTVHAHPAFFLPRSQLLNFFIYVGCSSVILDLPTRLFNFTKTRITMC